MVIGERSFMKHIIIKKPIAALAIVFAVIVSCLCLSLLSYQTLDEHASRLDSNDYFVSGSGHIWKIYRAEKSLQSSEKVSSNSADRIIVEDTGDMVSSPIKILSRKKSSSEMTVLELALTQYPPDEVFVRKDGSTWILSTQYYLPHLFNSLRRYTPPAE